MDKLKIFLANAKKHQFWICCGVMLLVSLGCWWWASSAVAKLYDTRETAIKGSFDGAKVQPGAPNQKVIDRIEQQRKDLSQKVYDAWKSIYDQQQKNCVFPTEVLGKEFEKAFKKLQLPKGELDSEYLEIYQNHIKQYLPELGKIINVRHEVDKGDGTAPAGVPLGPRPPRQGGFGGVRGGGFGGPGGFGGVRGGGTAGALGGRNGGMVPGLPPNIGGGGPMQPLGGGTDADKEYAGVVDWDEGDFASTLAAHFDWLGRAPTTIEVVMAEEDLSVYQTLLNVIKRVNAGASTQANAPIKRIIALDIGRDARSGWDEARQAVFVHSRTTLGGQQQQGGQQGPLSREQQEEETLFANRYIDDKGDPLPYDPEYPHAKHPNIEFKMMPVFLSFVMDQRRLPTLLVECANSGMKIEVRGVRVLKEMVPPFDPGTGGGGGGGGGGFGGGGGGGFGGGGIRALGGGGPGALGVPPPPGGMMRGGSRGGITPPMRPSGHAPAAGGGGAPQDVTGQFDVPVQLCAVIYIYNPPDRAKLDIPEEKTPAEAAAAASPPANAPVLPPSPNPTPRK